MKWFKHMADASEDSSVSKIEAAYGLEGYARYWKILEKVASQMHEPGQCSAEYTWQKWCQYLSTVAPRLRVYLADVQLWCNFEITSNGKMLKIGVPKLLKIKDNYQKDLEVTSKQLPSNLLPIKNKRTEKEQQQEREDTKERERKAVVVLPSAEGEESKNREALIRIGISPAKAMSLVKDFTPERIEAVLKALREANAKNPTGWVISALEDNWDLAKVLKQPKDMGASNVLPSEAEVKRRRQDEKETFRKVEREQEARQAAIKNTPPDEWGKAKELALKALKEEFPHISSSLSGGLVEHKALELLALTNEKRKS